MATSVLVCMLFLTTGCGPTSFDRDFRLSFWERHRTAAVAAYNKKDFKTARKRAQAALAEARSFGSADFRPGVTLLLLADICRGMGDFKQAAPLYKHSVEVLAAAEGRGTALERALVRQDRARALSHWADMCAVSGDYRGAISHFSKAIEIYEALCVPGEGGLNDSLLGHDLIRCLCGLAQVYAVTGDPASAEASYKRALDLSGVADYPAVLARDIRALYAQLLKLQNRDSELRDLMAEEEWTRLVAEGDGCLRRQDLAGARRCFARAVAESERMNSQARVIKSLTVLSEVVAQQKDVVELEKICQRALQLYRASGIKQNYDIDRIYQTLSKMYVATGRYEQGFRILQQQFRYREVLYGKKSLPAAEAAIAAAQALIGLKRYRDARVTADYAYAVLYPRYTDSKRGASLASQLAPVMAHLGDLEKAGLLYGQFGKFAIKRYGPAHELSIAALVMEAQLYLTYRDTKRAEKPTKQVMRLVSVLPDKDLVPLGPYLLLLAQIYFLQGQDARAEPLYCLVQRALAADPRPEAHYDPTGLSQGRRNMEILERRLGRPLRAGPDGQNLPHR